MSWWKKSLTSVGKEEKGILEVFAVNRHTHGYPAQGRSIKTL
jgi:hypothetical protein